MARANDFVDPDYDRRLLEFKERRKRMKEEAAQGQQETSKR